MRCNYAIQKNAMENKRFSSCPAGRCNRGRISVGHQAYAAYRTACTRRLYSSAEPHIIKVEATAVTSPEEVWPDDGGVGAADFTLPETVVEKMDQLEPLQSLPWASR